MKNYTYSGWKLNGFVALILNLAFVAAAVYSIVVLANSVDLVAWALATLITSIVCAVLMLCGYIMLEPNESRVLLFFGNYRGTFYDTGFWWINPFMSAKKLSMRARNLNVDPIKVNDKAGNPILIGLVVGVSVLSFVALVTSPALLTTDFITGLALACFFMVIILPILVLIYLTVMLLVSRRPSGKMMLAVFILWLLSLATMTISAIKSPVHFDRQIESAFESVFENDSDILYEEFSEQEIDEFRKQINNMDISTKQEGDVTVTLQGSSENIEKLEATLKIDENGVTISDQDGKLVEITPSGIKIDGKDFIDYTTETIQSVNGSTKAFIFSIGDVKVKIEKDLDGTNDLSEAIEKQKEANKQQEEINKETAKAMKNI